MGYTDYKDLPFNSSLAYLERMERRWEDSDNAKKAGDTVQYYRCLELIFRNAHPFFTEEEVLKCEDFCVNIEKIISSTNNRDYQAAGLWLGENQCDKFRMLLIKLLFKYKITYAERENKTWQEKTEEDFS